MRIFRILLFFLLLPLGLQAQDFTLNGDAVQTGPDCYRLTPASLWSSGSMWSATEIDLSAPFSLNFTASFDDNPGGADGIVFAFQSAGENALGPDGGSLGYEGIAPSFATEFDIFRNADLGDSNFDHIAVFRNGNVSHQSADNLYGPLQAGPGVSIKTGQSYQVKIDWQPDQNRFYVYFDCVERVFMTIDLINEIFGGDPMVYWGFTGATGGAASELEVCISNLSAELPQNEQSACPGEPTVLDSENPAEFEHSWSPAEFLDDPNSSAPVATVNETTVFTAVITDDCENTFTKEVVLNIDPLLEVDLGEAPTICEGDSALLSAPEGFTYLWSDGSTAQELWTGAEGPIYVDVTHFGCFGTDTVEITVSPGISALSLIVQDASCMAEDGSIAIAEAEGAEPPLSVLLNGNPAGDLLIEGLAAGTYTLTVSDINGCAITETAVVEMAPDAEAGFDLNPTSGVAPLETSVLDLSQNAGDGYYSYGGDLFPINSTFFVFDTAGTYEVMQVVWMGDPACADTAIVIVNVSAETELIVPNVVTPNNDGRNDLLTLQTKGIISLFFEVYNRWGNLVDSYESSSVADGRTTVWNPSEVSDGVYMYVLSYTDVNGIERNEGGSITIVRESRRRRF